MKGAIYAQDSKNEKLLGSQKVDATYASILHSCPETCSLKDEGCYGQTSFVGMVNAKMQRRARGASPLKIARAEAKAIDHSYNGGKVPQGRFLRLHVAGDSRTITGTRSLNAAIARWKQRGGGVCWSYTHAWKTVPRNQWNQVSILASIEKVEDAPAARQQGYAPALVVDHFETDKAFTLPGSDTKFIPCPAQTRQVGCTDCRLCFNANRLFAANFGIAFAVHGIRTKQLKRHLKVIQG